ncbi:Nif3-like dinuclear metal center hexameric protein [Bacteroidota bacterium]
MNRKDFISTSIIGAASLPLLGINILSDNIVTAQHLQDFLHSLHEVKEPSVDRIIIGDPGTRIKKVATAWMPYWNTLRKAKEAGANVLVVHEPTFYTHWDLEGNENHSMAKNDYEEVIADKKKWIEENGMVIIRCHDVLDILKDIGIPFALGRGLGLSDDEIIAKKDYYNVYKIETDTAEHIAKKIAGKLKTINQPGVAFYGDLQRPVSSIGMGTGCICDPRDYAELGAGLHIGIDDTIRTWIQTMYAEDTGRPLVVINHGASEEFGMQELSKLLDETLQAEVEHISQGCGYKFVSA